MANKNSSSTTAASRESSTGFDDLSDGRPYTSAMHRLFSDALPTRVLLLDTSKWGPVATLLFDDGHTRGIIFTDATQLDDPLFAKLPAPHADQLRQHVTNACRYSWAATKPTERFAKLSAGMNAGPKRYGAMVTGDCLVPHFRDGDVIVCDPDQQPREGDFVAVWWKDAMKLPSVKRLVLSTSAEDAEAAIVCEQLNPPHSFSVRISDVEVVHKVIGKALNEEVCHG